MIHHKKKVLFWGWPLHHPYSRMLPTQGQMLDMRWRGLRLCHHHCRSPYSLSMLLFSFGTPPPPPPLFPIHVAVQLRDPHLPPTPPPPPPPPPPPTHTHTPQCIQHQPWQQGLLGQHGAHLGPTGPRWSPCWPHKFCYLRDRCIRWHIDCSFPQLLQAAQDKYVRQVGQIYDDLLSSKEWWRQPPVKILVNGAKRGTGLPVAMMTSSNGNISVLLDICAGKFTGPRWIPRTKASDAEFWCFLWSASE